MGSEDLPQFALAVYRHDDVPAACLLLQNRVDLDVNLILLAAYVGAVRHRSLTVTHLQAATARVVDWHLEVIRPLRSVRQRLKSGPPPAPSPATIALRSKLQQLEIEAELIELGELDELAAGLDGPIAAGTAADRAADGITAVARRTAGRDLDDDEGKAVAVIAAAAALVATERG